MENDEYKLIEGPLKLKEGVGGWRHYIKDGQTDHDIHCGSYMEMQLGEYEKEGGWGALKPDRWLIGRYEAVFGVEDRERVRALLVIGTIYPSGGQAVIKVPEGALVRVRK